jgi:hypothetical protein
MMASVALRAPTPPPDTGASTKSTPHSACAAAMPLATPGAMVEKSRWIAPRASAGRSASARPATSALAVTLVHTISLPCATSATVAQRVAPSATAKSALAARRLQTRSSCPAFNKCSVMGWPMVPKPMKPIFILRPACSSSPAAAGR